MRCQVGRTQIETLVRVSNSLARLVVGLRLWFSRRSLKKASRRDLRLLHLLRRKVARTLARQHLQRCRADRSPLSGVTADERKRPLASPSQDGSVHVRR